MIRAAAAELPSVPLEDALDICLALLELEPDTYPRTATRWGWSLWGWSLWGWPPWGSPAAG